MGKRSSIIRPERCILDSGRNGRAALDSLSVTFVSSCRPSSASFLLGARVPSAPTKPACWKGENEVLTHLNEIPVSQRALSKASGRKAIHHRAQLLGQGSRLPDPVPPVFRVLTWSPSPVSPHRVPPPGSGLQGCDSSSETASLAPANPSLPLGALRGSREARETRGGQTAQSAALMGVIERSGK